jgi:hypothetical protein
MFLCHITSLFDNFRRFWILSFKLVSGARSLMKHLDFRSLRWARWIVEYLRFFCLYPLVEVVFNCSLFTESFCLQRLQWFLRGSFLWCRTLARVWVLQSSFWSRQLRGFAVQFCLYIRLSTRFASLSEVSHWGHKWSYKSLWTSCRQISPRSGLKTSQPKYYVQGYVRDLSVCRKYRVWGHAFFWVNNATKFLCCYFCSVCFRAFSQFC